MKIWAEVSEDHPDFEENLSFCSVISIVLFTVFGFYCGLISWLLREEISQKENAFLGIVLFIIVYLFVLFWRDRDNCMRSLKIFTISKNIQVLEQRMMIFLFV